MGDSVKMAAIGGARMGHSLATLGKMCALLCGMDVELPRNHAEYPAGLPHPRPPSSSQSSSRRSSINSERLYQIDNKAIPRKPGSARYRVLPEISDIDKDQEMAETNVAKRDVPKKDVRKPKEVGENGRERKVQGRKEEPLEKTVQEQGTRNKGQNPLIGSAAATRETTLSKKSQQIGNLSPQTSDNKPAKPETNEKTAKPVKGVGSYGKDSKERISPVRRILPQKPEQDEQRITLAVKLPTGERLQKDFRPSDPLQVILKFAESSSRRNFTGCELVCLEPKLILQNMKKDYSPVKLTEQNSPVHSASRT